MHCRLFPTHGCSTPHLLHPPFSKTEVPAYRSSQGQVWDMLLHMSGQSQEVGDLLSEQPGDRAGDGKKSVRSYPSLQPQGLGFGRYQDLGAT